MAGQACWRKSRRATAQTQNAPWLWREAAPSASLVASRRKPGFPLSGVRDCRPGRQVLLFGFAYIRSPKPTCLEADSFGSHARDADRDKFSRGLDRQNEVELANWNILRFSIDKLKEDPLSAQQHIRRMMEQWYGEERPDLLALPLYQREIVRLAVRSVTPITNAMACECLGKKRTFVSEQIDELVKEGWLEPASGKQRIRSYKLGSRGRDL